MFSIFIKHIKCFLKLRDESWKRNKEIYKKLNYLNQTLISIKMKKGDTNY